MKLIKEKDITDVTLLLFIQDATANDGSGLTGLVFNAAGLACYYVRPGAVATQINLITQTITGVHSDGGFVEVDATNMPGVYRFDPPDALFATGVDSVVVMLQGAASMAPVVLELQLDNKDDIDSTATESITTAKALEAILASVAGKTVVSTVDADTKQVEFYGRDGSTVIMRVEVSTTTSGLREVSELDPS